MDEDFPDARTGDLYSTNLALNRTPKRRAQNYGGLQRCQKPSSLGQALAISWIPLPVVLSQHQLGRVCEAKRRTKNWCDGMISQKGPEPQFGMVWMVERMQRRVISLLYWECNQIFREPCRGSWKRFSGVFDRNPTAVITGFFFDCLVHIPEGHFD